MYPQMVYHADVRVREKELAAAETETETMGCCSCAPLGRMISRCIIKRNGTPMFFFYLSIYPLYILDLKLVHPILIGRLVLAQ